MTGISLARPGRACAAGLLAMLAAAPIHAQESAFVTSADAGLQAEAPLTRAALRTRVADKVRVNYQGRAPVQARVFMVVSQNGRMKGGYASAPFTLRPGQAELPGDALPGADWFPEGGTPGAAFSWGPIGWIADWIFGSPEEEEFVGDTPPAQQTPQQKNQRAIMHGLMGYADATPATGTVLTIAIVPFTADGEGRGGSNSVTGVTFAIGND